MTQREERKMRRIDNQQGYALLMTLLVIVLFTIMGATLMMLTFNGTTKNDTREDIVQSTDLASKGLEHITVQITSELNKALTGQGLIVTDYVKEINKITSKYKCVGGIPIEQQATPTTGTKYSTCIHKIEDDLDSGVKTNSSTEYLRKNITFKSTGISGAKTEIVYAKYNIGSTDYPEFLNYVLGAFKIDSTLKDPADTKRFPALPGEGNLVLNGGSSIEGDLKVDGDLISSDYGIWKSGSYYQTESSVFPQLSGFNSTPSKVYIQGNLYKAKNMISFDNASESDYSKYVNSKGIYETNLSIDQLFLTKSKSTPASETITSPQRVYSDVTINPINFAQKNNDIILNPTSQNQLEINQTKEVKNVNRSGIETYLKFNNSKTACTKEWVWIIWPFYRKYEEVCKTTTVNIGENTFKFLGTNTFGKLGVSGNANLSEAESLVTKSGHIDGDLIIGTKGCTTNNKRRITIKGTYYIKGNLSICDKVLTTDAIFYVDGDVDIKESEIKGIEIVGSNQTKRNSSLMIFAKGYIHLSNNSVDKPTPSEFKGYLYSEELLEIYGVGSNIKIHGGISARKIILNALRGDGKMYYPTSTQQSLPKSSSRLQIIYDQDIIKNYSELDIQTEPWITNVSPPIELDRSYDAP